MAKFVDIVRVETSADAGTFGVLLIDHVAFCCTLEPYEFDNQVEASCIPAQQYICERHQSPKYGETFQVCDVPGRSHVLFHRGNTVDHTRGCIILGQYFDKLRRQRAVINSGQTFNRFMVELKSYDSFKLSIHRSMWG